MEDRDPAITQLYDRVLQGAAATADPATTAEERVAVRQKLKTCYEALIGGHPGFAAESGLVSEYWGALWYAEVRAGRASEARGTLAALFHVLWRARPAPGTDRVLCDLLLCLGDIERHTGRPRAARSLYERAALLAPALGRVHNQLAVANARDAPRALFHFLLALAVAAPFGAAKDNLRRALPAFARAAAPPLARLLAGALLGRLSGRKPAAPKARRAPPPAVPAASAPEVHGLWLCVLLDPGLLDMPELAAPVECLLRLLAHALPGLAGGESWAHPALRVLAVAVPGFAAKTRRFEGPWEQLADAVCRYCDACAAPVAEHAPVLLPEDACVRGIPCFLDLPPPGCPADLDRARRERVLAFAHSLRRLGELVQHRGRWLTRRQAARQTQLETTGLLLARQRLAAEVDGLEAQVAPRLALESAPWLLVDCAFLLQHWKRIAGTLDAQAARYLITGPVLAELDYAKLSQPRARAIIGRLAELAHAGSPCIRLQRPEETLTAPHARPALSPQQAHRWRFLEAVAYYRRAEGGLCRVCTDDPAVRAHAEAHHPDALTDTATTESTIENFIRGPAPSRG